MGEKKGFLFAIIIFACFFLPAGMDWFGHSVKTDHLQKSATQFQQLVQEQGGNTPTVQATAAVFLSNGLHTKITYDKEGKNPVPASNTRLKVGTKIHLFYYYERDPVFTIRQGKRILKTNNEVVVNRR